MKLKKRSFLRLFQELNRYGKYQVLRKYGNTITFGIKDGSKGHTATVIQRNQRFLCSVCDGNESILNTYCFNHNRDWIPLDRLVEWIHKNFNEST